MLLSISLFGMMWFLMIFFLTVSGDIQRYPLLYNKGLPLYYLITPFFYLYVKGSIDSEQSRFKVSHLWHVIPSIPALLAIIPYNLLSKEEQIKVVKGLVKNMDQLFIPNPYIVSNWHWIVLPGIACVYCIFLFLDIRKANKTLKLTTNATIWLYIYTAVLTLFFLCTISATLKAQFDANGPLHVFRNGKFVFLGCFCVFTLSLLFSINSDFVLGRRSPDLSDTREGLFSDQRFLEGDAHTLNRTDNENILPVSPEIRHRRKIDHRPKIIDPVLVNKVEVLMKQKEFFRRSGLTISEFSSYCDVPNHKLSELFNNHYKQTFNAYVNHLRIEYVKKRLAEGDWKRFTLEAISLDAGFVTRNTFIVTFKKITGYTPSAYISNLKGEDT
ncbi:AraC family transcriptional regulator [uncultured Pedobacter sp.]|uniref:helix-turn-helix domain-containing protein n=1 Tax=uncultured Pedobacter sp. TaxID=246139 RepID=UPI0025F5F137|nr:helix-turn-helix transcriptional regulator [uncultured Pedobacter sp.]